MRLRYLRDEAPSSSYRLRANFTYTEPISKISQLSLQYRFKYDFQERDKRSYAGYTPGELEFDSDLSNSYESGYQTHAVGPGFRLAKERNTLVANVYYQRSMLDGQVIHGQSDKISHGYDNVTYFLMGQFNFNRENSLRMFISSYTDNPRITSLQNVPDVTDAQNITNGNPDLNPSYNHRIRLHYVNSNVTKGRTFMWMFMMNATQDYNATHMVASPGTITLNGQSYTPNYYSRPVNMDGYWNLRTHLSYGFPIGFLKSNFNVMAGLTYTLTPSMLGGVVQNDGSITGGSRNDTNTIGYDFNAVLGSNISENVDFTLGWNGTYSEATNSLVEGGSKNRYFNHSAIGNMKFVLPLGFTFTAAVSYTQYLGFTNDYNDSFLLCNAYIGKKVFRNQRGEISVGVNDIFNQNKAFVRTVGSGWTQNATNSVIGRYFMVQFTYNLRRFGKKGSRNIQDYEGVEQPRRRGPGMMPPPPPGFH